MRQSPFCHEICNGLPICPVEDFWLCFVQYIGVLLSLGEKVAKSSLEHWRMVGDKVLAGGEHFFLWTNDEPYHFLFATVKYLLALKTRAKKSKFDRRSNSEQHSSHALDYAGEELTKKLARPGGPVVLFLALSLSIFFCGDYIVLPGSY